MTTFSDGHENMGGLISIRVALINDIDTFPSILDNECEAEIIFNSGKSWGDPITIPNRGRLINETEDTDQGFLHPALIELSLPKWTKDSLHYSLSLGASIIEATFANGDKILVGDTSHPVIVNYKSNTGMLAADRNETIVSLSHSAPYPCPFYNF
jgi:hypothetical protein